MNGAAVVENELSNANGAGVDETKDLAPNANGLEKGKLAFSEADEKPPKLFALMESLFSLLLGVLSSANAVDTTKSPRKAA